MKTDKGLGAWLRRHKEVFGMVGLLGAIAVSFALIVTLGQNSKKVDQRVKLTCEKSLKAHALDKKYWKRKEKEFKQKNKQQVLSCEKAINELSVRIKGFKTGKIDLPHSFTLQQCIYGGSGMSEDNKFKGPLLQDEGFKIIGIDLKSKKYLMHCLTNRKSCSGGLKTMWIKQTDSWFVKTNCRNINRS